MSVTNVGAVGVLSHDGGETRLDVGSGVTPSPSGSPGPGFVRGRALLPQGSANAVREMRPTR